MSSVVIRLRPTGPWRIGPDSGDRDRVERIYHSDALYSAVSRRDGASGKSGEWLDATARAIDRREPAVRFSSCFPFHGETLYVVPPQHLWPPPRVVEDALERRALRALRGRIAARGQAAERRSLGRRRRERMPDPATATAGSTLFRVSVRSSAAVDRGGDAVAPHSVACLEFTTGSGLWFLAEFADDAAKQQWSERVKAAIRLLADSGFGGERSRGWGRSQMPGVPRQPNAHCMLQPRKMKSATGCCRSFILPRTTPSIGSAATIRSPPAAAASKANPAGDR